jgi:hypothetical protein
MITRTCAEAEGAAAEEEAEALGEIAEAGALAGIAAAGVIAAVAAAVMVEEEGIAEEDTAAEGAEEEVVEDRRATATGPATRVAISILRGATSVTSVRRPNHPAAPAEGLPEVASRETEMRRPAVRRAMRVAAAAAAAVVDMEAAVAEGEEIMKTSAADTKTVSFFLILGFVDHGIEGAIRIGQKTIRGVKLFHLALGQHEHAIAVHDGVDSMRNCEHSSFFGKCENVQRNNSHAHLSANASRMVL